LGRGGAAAATGRRTRALYHDTRELLAELMKRWKTGDHLPLDADTDAAAAVVFALVHGLLVCHHLGADVPLPQLVRGLAALSAGITRDWTGAGASGSPDRRPAGRCPAFLRARSGLDATGPRVCVAGRSRPVSS
jgi:hypothetical protein